MRTKNILDVLDLMMLSLMILSLPSVEGPKNIFLVFYLVTRVLTEFLTFNQKKFHWSHWDSMFLTVVVTAFLSTIFAGMPHLEEWKGYKVLLTAILTGWFLSRARYTQAHYQFLFKLIVLGTLPPLFWGLYEHLVIHSRETLEIHSVGHVNHSAIYLVMVFGASLGWFLSTLNIRKETLQKKFQTILLGMLSLLFFISLIIGQSRGAFGIGVILGLSLIILFGKNKKIRFIGIASIISIILLTVLLKANIVQKHIADSNDNNVLAYRDLVWNVSLEASRFSPLLGIGMSNWHFISIDQLKQSIEDRGETFNAEKYFFPGHSHNLYLTALVERGIVGLIVTFIFMLTWIVSLIKAFGRAKRSNEEIFLWAGSFSAWVATFGIGLVNTTFHHEHAILACLFLGLYLSYTSAFKKV
ncbi:O-antigen ligase family protein [Candidatus Methylopumilus universalis]|uniref:O-antigen ligase family protein n=1 Tax=Candidatus Methylopumilus universalis TaxID=2588536 RepID=UPI00111FBCB0|nr:O-antigen ligase family protein [Candidatus Methylopumilus universalis]QDC96524.1 O-antigen ligase family protein [Candidatus Methylopumilus universalis]